MTDLFVARLGTLLAGLLLCISATAHAGEPALVRDLYPGTEQLEDYVDFGSARTDEGILYFGARDPAHGVELWRTDGTPAGTYRLTDICPGPCGSAPSELEIFRGEVYFSADDGVSGRELWASGTARNSARRVRDLCPGPCSGRPAWMKASGEGLFFEATAGTDRGLWISDGSRQGTVLVAKFCLDGGYGNCIFQGIHPLGDLVVFQRETSENGVWRSDGTPEGTGPLSDVVGAFPGLATFEPAGNDALFAWTSDGLWWTDGTAAGTRRLRTYDELGISPFVTPAFSARSTLWNGMLVAVVESVIVRSDGTPEGTLQIGQLPAYPYLIGFVPREDALLFAFSQSLWRTEGTAETTRLVTELPSPIWDIDALGDRVALCVEKAQTSTMAELWWSDGTAEGTRRAEGAPACAIEFPLTDDRLAVLVFGKLGATDGTPAGTSMVHDFVTVPASGGPLEQIAFRGRLLFTGRTSEDEAPLFLSDGTSSGTREVGDTPGWARGLTQAGNRVFFESRRKIPATISFTSHGLWTTDGSDAGTVQVGPQIREYGFPMPVGEKLFFSAARELGYYGQPDLELFGSDGTVAGTGVVKNINDFGADSGFHHFCYNAPSSPGPGIDLRGRLLFVADDGQRGRELWISNGKGPGTHLLGDLDPRRLNTPPPGQCDDNRQRTGLGSEPRDFLRFRNKVFFTAADGDAGRELWRTDGTKAGTRRIKDIRPGVQGSEPHDLVIFQGKVWFVASSAGGGEEIWRTDGTPEGTVLVRQLTFRAYPSWARSLTVAGGRLFFVLSNEIAGPELWVTGGTAASTHQIADLRPGPEGSYPQSLTAAGGLLLFAADDGEHGLEPWQSDGTAAGTVLVKDLNPGLDASGPGPFTPVDGGLVLTGADDGEHGRELWALPVEADP